MRFTPLGSRLGHVVLIVALFAGGGRALGQTGDDASVAVAQERGPSFLQIIRRGAEAPGAVMYLAHQPRLGLTPRAT